MLLINLIWIACEKPTENLVMDGNNNSQGAVNVLNDNAGFDTLFNITKNLQGVGTTMGEIDILDYTLESNGNFNYVYSSSFQSQQSMLYSYYRKSYSTSIKEHVALPSGADKSNKTGAYNFFRPYSNFFNYCLISTTTTAGNIVYTSSFRGDVSVDFPKRNTIFGEPDMGFLYPMINSHRFPGNPNYDYRQGFLTVGALTLPNSYLYRVCNPKSFAFEFTTNPATPKVLANLFDISIINKGLSQSKFEDISYTFDIRSDSMFVHHVYDTIVNGLEIQRLIKITGISIASGLSNNSNLITKRHYSLDGKILSMFFQDLSTRKCWTFVFNYTTHTLTAGVPGLALSYGTENSDIDIDEVGQIYYSGIASNGSNMNGVSIYKMNAAGTHSLIGSDNFLKFGEIIKLKFLLGKVYLVVRGRISNTYIKQLSIIKQQ